LPAIEQPPAGVASATAVTATAEPEVVKPNVVRETSPRRKMAFIDRGQSPRWTAEIRPDRAATPLAAGSVGEAARPTLPAASATAERAPTVRQPAAEPAAVPSSPSPVIGIAPSAGVAGMKKTIVPPQTQAQPSVAGYLTETVRLLRAERSPTAALRFLDDHDGELAKSGFRHEALLLRVEILLALGRRGEVLRLLDGASLTDVAASGALLVTRGQLRAAANRCADGIGDFDLVLARSRQADRQALLGRALCRKQLGDSAGMRADIQRLRNEFPTEVIPRELEK
jgi:hypothetical protein